MHQFLKFIFGIKLYMFRTEYLSNKMRLIQFTIFQKYNKLNKSQLVGQLLNSIHDARTHVYQIYRKKIHVNRFPRRDSNRTFPKYGTYDVPDIECVVVYSTTQHQMHVLCSLKYEMKTKKRNSFKHAAWSKDSILCFDAAILFATSIGPAVAKATWRHFIDRVAARRCCAVNVLTSRISFFSRDLGGWGPWSSIIC